MFKTLVVAIDGSDPAQHALTTACTLAQRFGADLHIVHSPQVETTMFVYGYMVSTAPVTPDRIAEAGREVMETATRQAEAAGVTPAGTHLGRSDPEDDILEIAKLHDADLIVTGRRGLGSVASLFLGSVSLKVAQAAQCSILTVH